MNCYQLPKDVVSKIPTAIRYVLNGYSENEICIAGGACLALFNKMNNSISQTNNANTEFGDWDIFCSSSAMFDKICREIDIYYSGDEHGYNIHVSERATSFTFKRGDDCRIQVIRPYDFEQIASTFYEHVISNFDFTICQVIIAKENNEYRLIVSEVTLEDILEKQLRFTENYTINYYRIYKYIKKGYRVTTDILFCMTLDIEQHDYSIPDIRLY